MELWIGALNLGFLYAFMAMGVFITFRINDFPDITVDGSFTSGAAAAAVLLSAGYPPAIAVLAAFVIGALAGGVTALIHTKLDINGLLAGILVMTGLYSINLHVMKRSNIPLLNETTFLTYLSKINPGIPEEILTAIALSAVMAVFWVTVTLFFKTDFGLAMRVTGNNPDMSAASGVNVHLMKIFGVGLANGFVGVSGGLVAQYQGFADIGMGIGTILIGLASVIIGESVLRIRSMYAKVLSVIIGSVIFRFMIAFALYAGMNPMDLKLLTALFVLATLVVSMKMTRGEHRKWEWVLRVQSFLKLPQTGRQVFSRPKLQLGLVGVVVLIAAGIFFRFGRDAPKPVNREKVYKIGVVQISDHGLLNITRDSFLEEMARIGYRPGETCQFIIENANGDLPTVNTILDKFVYDDVDVVLTISTPCTQPAIKKIKDRPVVFATVANPFIIGAGKSDTNHLPNVTGVYGGVPMDKTMALVRGIFKGKLKVGAVWDPSHANSVFNVNGLKKAVKADPDATFLGANITNSSEVYLACQSLVHKGIDIFVLAPDNIVYSAFESVVKAARPRKIPIFISDVERMADGALGALGYDYASSGQQAARVVDRILKGENPKDIPFERYRKLTIGFNLDVAKEIGVTIPEAVLARATHLYGAERAETGIARKKADGSLESASPLPVDRKPRKMALFRFSDHAAIVEIEKGIMDRLKRSGVLEKFNISVHRKSAQNDFAMAQAIAQDIVRQQFDYILTITTPALQVTAQFNKKIPHIFGGVTDPYRMGVAKNTEEHQANVTGVATLQPVEATIDVMRELFPDAERIGIVWNPAEACSEACTYKARDAVKKSGFELMEVSVSNTGEVMDAVNALINRGVDLFLTSGDNTVMQAIEPIARKLIKHKIPYFTNNPPDVSVGAFVSMGADYYQVGQRTAEMAIRVINGEAPKKIPIDNFAPAMMFVNRSLAKQYGLKLSEQFLRRATEVKESS